MFLYFFIFRRLIYPIYPNHIYVIIIKYSDCILTKNHVVSGKKVMMFQRGTPKNLKWIQRTVRWHRSNEIKQSDLFTILPFPALSINWPCCSNTVSREMRRSGYCCTTLIMGQESIVNLFVYLFLFYCGHPTC